MPEYITIPLFRDSELSNYKPLIDGNCYKILHQLTLTSSVNEIATELKLHENTVIRWLDNQSVPQNYKGDLKRMLGLARDPVDQFFTKPHVARYCYKVFSEVMSSLGIDTRKYYFIEPSAGEGAFLNLMPKSRRIGLDMEPHGHEIKKHDYLQWTPEFKKIIVLGNPPFGLRGHLALNFLNHSAKFADVVAFILPQLFESDGKGVPAKRVSKDMRLAHSEKLGADSFSRPNGSNTSISTVFQIWTKIAHKNIKIKAVRTCKSFINLYSLSDGGTPASTRNKKMIDKCDVYLPSTCFNGMQAYKDFQELPHKRGYGIVIKKEKVAIRKLFMKHNWEQTAFLSTNGANNLRFSLIEDVAIQGGYYDV